MNKEANFFEKIDAYLLGKLSQEDQLNFVTAMEKNIKLQEEVMLRREMMKGIKMEGRKRLSQTLEEIHNKKDRTLSKTIDAKRKRLQTWLAVAAAIALILSCWFIFQSPSNNTLTAQYYKPYELTIGLRDNSNEEQLAKIDALYSAEKYSAALPIIANYLSTNPTDNLLRLALAICQYENKNSDGALQSLQVIKDDAFLQDQVSWYSALIYLEQGERESAKDLLKELTADSTADHYMEAQSLMNKLK